MLRARPGWIVVLSATLLAPSSASAQAAVEANGNRIDAVAMTVEPSTRRGAVNNEERADYDVVLRYRVKASGDPWALTALSVDDVTLQGIGLRFAGSIVEGVWTRTGSQGPGGPQLWSANVPIPSADELQDLEIRYTVVSAFHGGDRLTIPLVALDGAPPEPLPGAFEAGVVLPGAEGAGFHVTQSFPVDVDVFESPVGRTVSATLPVVPRFLRFDLRPGPPTLFARISMLEAIATILIVLFGALGWRHLQASGS